MRENAQEHPHVQSADAPTHRKTPVDEDSEHLEHKMYRRLDRRIQADGE